MKKPDCPICDVETQKKENGDFWCPQCYRSWYEVGGGNLASRPRRVKIKKKPEKGDHIDDIVEPYGGLN